MKARRKPTVSINEQMVLDGVTVRVIETEEQERFDQLLVEQYYVRHVDARDSHARCKSKQVNASVWHAHV